MAGAFVDAAQQGIVAGQIGMALAHPFAIAQRIPLAIDQRLRRRVRAFAKVLDFQRRLCDTAGDGLRDRMIRARRKTFRQAFQLTPCLPLRRRRQRPRDWVWLLVTVPVLSSASTLMARAFSRWTPPLIKMPRRAAAARPLTTVTGVEITRAQGQAITSSTKAL